MNSLVAYENSDSEGDDAEDNRTLPSDELSSRTPVPTHPPSDFNVHRPNASTFINASSVACPYNAPEREPKCSMHPLPYSINVKAENFDVNSSDSHMSRSASHTQKRPPSSDCGVKPYIPKRLRQEQSNMMQEVSGDMAERSQSLPGLDTRSMYSISPYLEPHLPVKYNSSGIPKNLVFQMSEHSGPVNRVQWCPVRQYSHLLLSASMDGTVKVWDAMDSGKCLRTFSCHRAAVRDAQWSACGMKILSGGFDSVLHLTDVETGKGIFTAKNEFKISAVRFHPNDSNVFICGGFSSAIRAWDVRMDKVIHIYKAAVQQHFDLLFLPGGKEFLSTTDSVSRDSADRTIIAWDFGTTARISNQIFHERYTCPSLALHPNESAFAAQTNGNYIALFSTQRPFKMNKRKRFEGHKVEGFAVGCQFSPDGSLMVTGSSEGTIFFYNYHTSKIARTIPSDGSACVSVTYHPVLPSLLASSYWDGHIRVWQ